MVNASAVGRLMLNSVTASGGLLLHLFNPARTLSPDSTASRAVRSTQKNKDVVEHAAVRGRGNQTPSAAGVVPCGICQAKYNRTDSVSADVLNVRGASWSRRCTTATTRRHVIPPTISPNPIGVPQSNQQHIGRRVGRRAVERQPKEFAV